ncbi:MAG TPA: hypothetical protein PK010_09265 [Alphaproteobacteria bacterium]|nr:hypothetical protein [Alphaproteobacteria bacterium]
MSTTGVGDAGEFVEISDGTWEVHRFLHARSAGSIGGTSAHTTRPQRRTYG